MATNLEAWRIFLKGRIAQENGRADEALELIEQAVSLEPSNSYFLGAKAFALSSLNRKEDALVSKISRDYSELAAKYSGDLDTPENWLNGLKNIANSVEDYSRDGIKSKISVVW